jgi:riboflavin synthase alpha subunit
MAAFGRDSVFCTNCCLGATNKKLNEKASLYEGHGFSRAVNGLCLTASAAEVRFFKPTVFGFL